jgi:hypothetical protein
MPKLQPEVRRAMLRAWALMFTTQAVMTGSMLWHKHEFGILAASLATIPALFALLPLVVEQNRIRQLRHNEQRAAWRATYKVSPASHYLHLNNE